MSRFGANRGVPEYDRFRTGLTYKHALQLCAGRKYHRRGTVLGVWNEVKRDMWYQLTGQRL